MDILEGVSRDLVSGMLVLGKLSVVGVVIPTLVVFDGYVVVIVVVRTALVRDGSEIVTVVGRTFSLVVLDRFGY